VGADELAVRGCSTSAKGTTSLGDDDVVEGYDRQLNDPDEDVRPDRFSGS
jgi:hypothetical protein